MRKARDENFPVAPLILPRRQRRHLLALYGFARLTDDIGDEAPGDRLALLDWLETELEAAFTGTPAHPVLGRLAVTLKDVGLPRQPFLDLIEANRRDQIVTRYETFTDLLGYCRLSANPVGRLVLAVFAGDSPENRELSDAVCTGLQLAEHCQDVAEDYGNGRVYLPQDDMASFGCREADLAGPRPTPALRGLIAFEVRRARAMLDAGAPLIGRLDGRLRLAVAGFVAGGLAALDAVERGGYDVFAGAARPRPARLLGHAVVALIYNRKGKPWT